MAGLTETLRLVITGDSKGAQRALDEMGGKAGAAQTRMQSTMAGLNKAANVAAVGFVALTAVIGKSVKDYQDYGSSIRDIQRISDMSTESASKLVGEWQRFGVDATAGANGVKFFSKNLDAAKQGANTQVTAFQRLGISMKDIKTMSEADLLTKTRNALATMGPSAERTAIALQIFGKGGAAMMPWLNVAPKQMAEVDARLKDLGLVWGDKQMAQFAKSKAAWAELQLSLTGISQTIARDVIPALTPLFQGFGKLLEFLRPVAPLLVPLTIALGAFVAIIKTAVFFQNTWGQLLSSWPVKLIKSALGIGTETAAVTANTAAVTANTVAKRANAVAGGVNPVSDRKSVV